MQEIFLLQTVLIVVSSGCSRDDRSQNPEELELVRDISESPQSIKAVLPTQISSQPK